MGSIPSPAPFFVAWRIPALPSDAAQHITSFHSLDAPTVHLIECVDRSVGRVRSRCSHPSVIDPKQCLAKVCLAAA